jgi:3-deoxy-manno-octulosonate cytidylyltransferase (CMP-KDO synthetase)
MLPFVVAIPARLGSMRLPQKPLRDIAGKPMIVRVVECAQRSGAQDVVVATDSERIAEAVSATGARVCMTQAELPSGTDRIAEAAQQLQWADDTLVVNLQGDEPLAPASGIRAVARLLQQQPDCSMATLATPVEHVNQLLDPNCVKVVRDKRERALYFSRAPIPWPRDAWANSTKALPSNLWFFRHIGIYAYRVAFLKHFVKLPISELEKIEALEQLRVLDHGYSIIVGLAPETFPSGVDTEDDLARVNDVIKKQ